MANVLSFSNFFFCVCVCVITLFDIFLLHIPVLSMQFRLMISLFVAEESFSYCSKLQMIYFPHRISAIHIS